MRTHQVHEKRSICHRAAFLMAACLALPAGPAASQAPDAGIQPVLQVETGSHSAFIRRIDVAQDRGLAVTASDDKSARVWDLATGELRQVLRPAVGSGEIGRLYGVAIHPTEDLVALGGTTGSGTGQHRILLFSLASGQFVRAFDARGGDIRKLAWSRDGSLLLAVYAGDNALRAFDPAGVMIHEQSLTEIAQLSDTITDPQRGLLIYRLYQSELVLDFTRPPDEPEKNTD